MTHEEHVEAMARAIFAASEELFEEEIPARWNDLSSMVREDWRAAARVALAKHPAVEILRSIVALQDMDDWDIGDKRAHSEALNDARALLAEIEDKQ